MKNKKTFVTLSSCSIVIFVVSFFLLNSASAGKDCGVSHTSKAPTVVVAAQEPEQPVDEHAGHNHAPAKVQEKQVDEHAGHNHAPKKAQTNNH
jgi:hypothetical protein